MKNSWTKLENNKIIQEEVNNEFFFFSDIQICNITILDYIKIIWFFFKFIYNWHNFVDKTY